MIPIEQLLALVIFFITIFLVITERIHRCVAVIMAVVLLIVFRILDIEEAVHFVDFETILLLAGMMIIVEVLKELGFFHYVAIKMAKTAKNYKRFFLLMCLATSLLSPFLDSVTVVLIFSSITIAICRIIKRDPKPLLLSQVFCSNIGGNATLIGEPTNIMVATHKGFTFIDFIRTLTPITILSLLLGIFILMRLFKPEEEEISDLVYNLDERSFVKDPDLLKRAVIVFLLTIFLFFIHNLIGLTPSSVALLGACLILITTRVDITSLLSRLEWSTLVFIGGFFIVVGGLSKTGVTHEIAESIAGLPFVGPLLVIIVGIIAIFGSAIIDNIPFVAVMIPVIDELSEKLGSDVLWWVLLAGANLGGNLTPIAASPNIVVLAISEREGSPISSKDFIRSGVVIVTSTVSIALLLITLMYILGFL